ncbi:9107_t:CDS:2 [Ambispora leptoticha]|uniref:9107_t:CDS:1 n=1 Tax=Ambispora leptoticha TaxID=144679 RepID=A0A9N8Z1A7_9GLOM|nr:9107_t:CDS:2 [Ambispora leptoticha]
MKNEPQSTSNINEINRCESRFSVVTISIQSMISTTTALPNQSTFSWIYEKIKNAFKFGNQAEQTPEEVISDVLKECSAKSPVTNANGTNRCESRFALVNYCQQYMVTTTTET